ncbi:MULTISPECIES: hypothetical protein [Roseomonadaceae]|uniref:Uncharacterized protein n=1 Tax=Falsiroseomonas oleicola TaxID=2801474 RepID=A0ABS6HBP5_9PROT|nr:hypothetical protein [Roseomonas oleicola]MBU8546152.1 hypothetical protein [Roseomonas oleicola]
MARRLTDGDIALAVRLLDGWTGKLTWERYLALLATELGGTLYTKAGLRKQPRILNAWQMARRRLEGSLESAGVPSNGDAAIAQLREMLRRLRNENARLEQENQDLLERFQRWAHNAAIDKGMTLDQLNRPIVVAHDGGRRPRAVR